MKLEQAEQRFVNETKDKKPLEKDYTTQTSHRLFLLEWYIRFSLWLLKQNKELTQRLERVEEGYNITNELLKEALAKLNNQEQ